MNNCPICNSVDFTSFYKVDNVPSTSHLLCNTRQKACGVRRGNIDLVVCHRCTFIWNKQFDESILDYNENYSNDPSLSTTFQEHTKYVMDKVLSSINNARLVVEIGSGSGSFLKKLEQERPDLTYVGFDPTGGNNLVRPVLFPLDKRVVVQGDFFIARHLIEHLGKPRELLHSIEANRNRVGNEKSQQAFRFMFETPDSDWIINNVVPWDLFYEHCSLFNKESMKALTNEYEGKVENCFSNQFLLYIGGRPSWNLYYEPNVLSSTLDKVLSFSSKAKSKLDSIRDKITNRTAIWGVGAKGVTLANLLDPRAELIRCGFEINPLKINKFIPGTGHPIYHADSIMEHDIDSIILMNPNYKNETIVRLARLQSNVEIIEI